MRQMRVRMYRLGGIGDCFLLSFPKKKGTAHMLIDCGVLMGTAEGGHIRAAIADVVETTRKRLDVLVVTHEHWDHVSGFEQAKDEFAQLKIGEVWLAWTEDPNHDLANQLRQRRTEARQAVDAARQRLRLSGGATALDSVKALDGLSLFSGDFGAAGRASTASAMTWAREQTHAPVRYLRPGGEPVAIPGADGVRAFVLGPPEDPGLLKKSDPSKRAPEVYQLAGGVDLGFKAALAEPGGVDTGRPFDPSFELPSDRAKDDAHFGAFYYSAEDWRRIDQDWLGTAERLALQLDSDTNNTSLALAIELVDSGRVLLFPGDAQVGNWLSWEPLTWNTKDRNGERSLVTSKNLLARTVLYKAGHHASHNATLREKGLELMQSNELATMIPVYEDQAHAQGKAGWEMPFPALLQELQNRTSGRVMRADLGLPGAIREATPGQLPPVATDTYIDYTIDMKGRVS